MGRWIGFFISIAFGLALGLVYGWFLNPPKSTDTRLETLRIDYKSDYVLMVAEGFQKDNDIVNAVRHLEKLGVLPVDVMIEQAIAFAQKAGYTEPDIARMQTLLDAVRTKAPLSGSASP